jgi:myo-inositol catabolism protein IolS
MTEPLFSPLGLGCWAFDPASWEGQRDGELLEAMEASVQNGVTHFDTATGYGSGYSERLVGRFLGGRREKIHLASKSGISSEDSQDMLENVRRSLERLRTDSVDLYYIHWPRSDMDLRPAMEGLEQARQIGLIKKVGVSNFTVKQVEQAAEVGRIDAFQTGYNLFWRYPERDVLPYCRERGIPFVTYGSIAMGILTGKFPRQLNLPPGDQRWTIVLFQEPAWAHVWQAVEELKTLARQIDRPLQHLAIRWVLSRPGIASVLVGARNAAQAQENASALQGEIPASVLDRVSEISDKVMRFVPEQENMYGFSP